VIRTLETKHLYRTPSRLAWYFPVIDANRPCQDRKRCPGSVSRRAYAFGNGIGAACVAARWIEGCLPSGVSRKHTPSEANACRVDNNVWIDRLTPARPFPIREALHRSLTAAAAVEGGIFQTPCSEGPFIEALAVLEPLGYQDTVTDFLLMMTSQGRKPEVLPHRVGSPQRGLNKKWIDRVSPCAPLPDPGGA